MLSNTQRRHLREGRRRRQDEEEKGERRKENKGVRTEAREESE